MVKDGLRAAELKFVSALGICTVLIKEFKKKKDCIVYVIFIVHLL